jgi:predicted ferric reductase
MYWYLARASGLVAFWLLTLSGVLGMSITSRLWDGLLGRAWVYEMHKFLSLLALAFIGLHIAVLIPDPWTSFGVADLLLPGFSIYRPFAVALGVVAMYGAVVATGSFYVKRWIGHRVWRLLHFVTFATFALALVHGVLAGTDSGAGWMQFNYLVALFLVFFLLVVRILAVPLPKPARRQDVAAG